MAPAWFDGSGFQDKPIIFLFFWGSKAENLKSPQEFMCQLDKIKSSADLTAHAPQPWMNQLFFSEEGVLFCRLYELKKKTQHGDLL